MASLKEVKNRISMVTGTRKITSAMKMVASSKLHRASSAIEQMRPYEAAIGRIMASFMSGTDGDGLTSPLAAEREVKRATLVVFTSNSSLCGGFNAHAIAAMHHAIADYRARGVEIVRVWCFGRKGAEAARRSGYPVDETYVAQTDHPTYAPAADLARLLMQAAPPTRSPSSTTISRVRARRFCVQSAICPFVWSLRLQGIPRVVGRPTTSLSLVAWR